MKLFEEQSENKCFLVLIINHQHTILGIDDDGNGDYDAHDDDDVDDDGC